MPSLPNWTGIVELGAGGAVFGSVLMMVPVGCCLMGTMSVDVVMVRAVKAASVSPLVLRLNAFASNSLVRVSLRGL